MISTLSGQNAYELKAELERRVAAFTKKYGELGLERIDCSEQETSRIVEQVKAMPFLVEKRLVILREPSQNKQLTESIEALLDSVNEETDMIIYEPKLDKRLVYYKTLKAKTELIEFSELDEYGLVRWLNARAKEKGGTLSSVDATYLVNRVGSNQRLLANELDKLILFDSHVTRETIDNLTVPTPRSSVFNLLDAAFGGNTKKTMDLYDEQRELRVEPLAILAMIGWQLHILAIVKTAGEKSTQQIATEAKLNTFVVQKSQNTVRGLSLAEIKKLVSDALKLDIQLKSKPVDADEALRLFLMTIAERA